MQARVLHHYASRLDPSSQLGIHDWVTNNDDVPGVYSVCCYRRNHYAKESLHYSLSPHPDPDHYSSFCNPKYSFIGGGKSSFCQNSGIGIDIPLSSPELHNVVL